MPTRSRFSVEKATRFAVYSRTTSSLHKVAVICLFPVPGLLVALALALVPLQSPVLGALTNWGFFIQLYALNWLWMVCSMAQARTVSSIPRTTYPTRAIVWIATIAAPPCVALDLLVGCAWRFPVPFLPAFSPLPFMVGLVVAHAVIFRGGRLPASTRAQLLRFVPSLAIQVSQLAIYPFYSALFATAVDWQQFLLVLAFPFIKFALRRGLFAVSRHTKDFAKENAVSGVEISASIYQAMILQTTPAAWVTGLIIALDVIVGIAEVRLYMEKRSVVPVDTLFSKATDILETQSTAPLDDELKGFETHWMGWLGAVRIVLGMDTRHSTMTTVVPTKLDNADKRIVTHALEMLQAGESIVLIEYLEVVVPIAIAVFSGIASQLASASYNTKLRQFHEHPSTLPPAIATILLYTGLQAVTLVGMGAVLYVRYRLSALTLLAFVLETHGWSLQSKMVMWLSGTLVLPIVHYGMDFTFAFDYGQNVGS